MYWVLVSYQILHLDLLHYFFALWNKVPWVLITNRFLLNQWWVTDISYAQKKNLGGIQTLPISYLENGSLCHPKGQECKGSGSVILKIILASTGHNIKEHSFPYSHKLHIKQVKLLWSSNRYNISRIITAHQHSLLRISYDRFCPSVCPSQSGIMSKLLQLHWRTAPWLLVSSWLTSPRNSKENIGSGGTEWERGSENSQFLTNKLPYLRNSAR